MRCSLLRPSTRLFFRQVESKQSTSMLVDLLFTSYLRSMLLQRDRFYVYRPVSSYHTGEGTTKGFGNELFGNRVLSIEYHAQPRHLAVRQLILTLDVRTHPVNISSISASPLYFSDCVAGLICIVP